jgi:predicted ATPase
VDLLDWKVLPTAEKCSASKRPTRDNSVAKRAATSLARLLAAHNRRDEAKAGLVPVVASITEGFADADFKQAAALLLQLD